MKKKYYYSAGDKYGYVTLTGNFKRDKYSKMYLEYTCCCGIIKWADFKYLRDGNVKSCGCKKIVHGLRNHPLYMVWSRMKQKCYNKNKSHYADYGARGVVVCDEWRDNFKAFYDWAIENGWRNGLELDKDKFATNGVGMEYSPKFCSFITNKENALYRRSTIYVEYKGETKRLATWCDELGLPVSTIRGRISRNKWDIERAFTEKIRSAPTPCRI